MYEISFGFSELHKHGSAFFDFLALRMAASDEHAADVAFWREAQLHPSEAVAASEHEAQEADEGEADAPRKRRRRRRPGTAAQAPA